MHDAGGRPCAHTVVQRAGAPGDGQRREQLEAHLDVVPHHVEKRDERVRGQPVEERQSRAVDEADTRERDAGLREQARDDADAGCRRAPAGLHGAELLDEHLGREVVAHAVHPVHDRGERRRVDRPERHGVVAGRAVGGARPRRGRLRARAPSEELRSGECRVVRRVAADAAAVDDERRERRRLVDVERGLPARRRATRVEPRLVAEHAPGDARDPVGPHLPCERGQIGGRERRVAVALQDEIPLPGRAERLPVAEDVRLDREAGPERRERRVGDGELLVRGGKERQRRVAGVHGGAGGEVEGHRSGRGEAHVRDAERALERRLQGRLRGGGGHEDAREERGGGGADSHARQCRACRTGPRPRRRWAARPIRSAAAVPIIV